MSVSIEQIKELRSATGISMSACKKALEEANGDYDGAVEILRKKGAAKAADRAERVTEHGVLVVKSEGGKTALVQLNCETDFVSMGDDFAAVANDVAAKLLAGEISAEDRDIEVVKEAVLKLGENVQIGNMALYTEGTVGAYIHSNKRMGAAVQLDGGSEELASEIAMHVTAANPKVISPDEISQELVDKEKSIWSEQLAAEGKPAEIMEKIMMGKEKKFREESALLKQAFVKNPDTTIEGLLKESGATIKSFDRFAI